MRVYPRHDARVCADFLTQGEGFAELGDTEIDERAIDRTMAMIRSMTPRERANPKLLNAGRRRRIAAGSGMKVEDVNRLVKQLEMMQQMFKQIGGGKGGRRGRRAAMMNMRNMRRGQQGGEE